MVESENPDEGRYLGAAAAGLLAGGCLLSVFSLALAFAAATALVLAGGASFGGWLAVTLVLLGGLPSAYLVLRFSIDLALFRALARSGLPAGRALADLDAALATAGWLAADKRGRGYGPRLAGVRRLVWFQGLVVLAQALVLVLLPWLH